MGQRFEVDNEAFRQHFINEVEKVEGFRSARVEGRPKINKPFSGVHLIRYTVRPPSARRSPNDWLIVNFHFTVRHGVVVQVFKAGPDAVGVLIAMNPAGYRQAPLPRKMDWGIPYNRVSDHIPNWLTVLNAIGHPLAGILIHRV